MSGALTAAEVAVAVIVSPVTGAHAPASTAGATSQARCAEELAAMPAQPESTPPVPAESMRAALVGSAWSDVKRATWLILFCITALSAYHTARLRYFDPRDYYAYQGTAGPYEVLTDDQGHTDPGPAITAARPGQAFGWLASLCLDENASMLVELDLVRLAQTGFPEAVVAHKESALTPVSKRCGVRFNVWSVPPGSLPGQYEVRRRVVIRPNTWFPIFGDFPPVAIAVLPTAPQAIIAPVKPSADNSAYKRIDL